MGRDRRSRGNLCNSSRRRWRRVLRDVLDGRLGWRERWRGRYLLLSLACFGRGFDRFGVLFGFARGVCGLPGAFKTFRFCGLARRTFFFGLFGRRFFAGTGLACRFGCLETDGLRSGAFLFCNRVWRVHLSLRCSRCSFRLFRFACHLFGRCLCFAKVDRQWRFGPVRHIFGHIRLCRRQGKGKFRGTAHMSPPFARTPTIRATSNSVCTISYFKSMCLSSSRIICS